MHPETKSQTISLESQIPHAPPKGRRERPNRSLSTYNNFPGPTARKHPRNVGSDVWRPGPTTTVWSEGKGGARFAQNLRDCSQSRTILAKGHHRHTPYFASATEALQSAAVARAQADVEPTLLQYPIIEAGITGSCQNESGRAIFLTVVPFGIWL